MVTLYNVVSSDGFIARTDGSEDFIPDHMWPKTLEVFKKYGTLVMGRKTYDALQKYDVALLKPFEQLPIKKIVISQELSFKPKVGYAVARTLEEATANPNTLVSSGPTLNTELLKRNMISEILLHVVPVTVGEGIKQFKDGTEPLLSKIKTRLLAI